MSDRESADGENQSTTSPLTKNTADDPEVATKNIFNSNSSGPEFAKLTSQDSKNIIEDSLEFSERSEVLDKSPDVEEKHLPALEVTTPLDSTDDDKNSDAESGINLLCAITEEGSASSSVSELIDPDVKEISEKEEEEIQKEESLIKEETIVSNASSKSDLVEKQNEDTDLENQRDEIEVAEENEKLKSRIVEISLQLNNVESEIGVLRHSLSQYEGEDELKNPTLLLNKLTAQEAESERLKEEILRQNEMLDSATDKQAQLQQQVDVLITDNEIKSNSLTQKQAEIEKLDSKVTELASVIQSLSLDKTDEASQNGLTASTALNDSTSNSMVSINRKSSISSRSRRPKQSKVCVIL